jgi:RNA polymerase sigma-70 factor (ECF subfamily)
LAETDLILRARQGDDQAWAELIRSHQEAVFRLAYLHLSDPAEAEDAAQECFIRAFRNLHRFDLTKPMRPWLLSIVVNLAHNRRRAAGRYWAALQRAAQGQPLVQYGPDTKFGANADRTELWAAIKSLPSKMQTILYLRYFLEIPTGETAQALNIAEGTVKSQTHRAIERLRQVIKEHYPNLWEDWK